MGRSLLLNASFEPLCVVTARRAVVLVLKEKAEVLEGSDQEFHAERLSIVIPSVIRLTRYVQVPHRNKVPLSRRAVFARDSYSCQYCSRPAENIDHVVPRSRGGEHSWDNVVAACKRCNARKEDRLLAESGLALRRPPQAPHGWLWLVATGGGFQPSWTRYLPDTADAIPA